MDGSGIKYSTRHGFAIAGAGLTFFGFTHGEAIGSGQSPLVAISYFMVGAILLSCAPYAKSVAKPAAHEQPEPMMGTADCKTANGCSWVASRQWSSCSFKA